jgi:hypothetical protein
MRERQYFEEIENVFRAAIRKPLYRASPLEWTMIETWEQAGIPLDVVLRGVLLAVKDSKGQARSLRFCDYAVMGLATRLQAGTIACECGERYDPQRAGWNSGRDVKTCEKCAPPREVRVVTSGVCSDCHKDQPILVEGVCNTCQLQREKCSDAKEGLS